MKLQQTEKDTWRFDSFGYSVRIEQEDDFDVYFDVYVDGFRDTYSKTVNTFAEAVEFATDVLLKDIQNEINGLVSLKVELLAGKLGF
jgi:hypothetical protein